MKVIKAVLYTGLGAELSWAWLMGHNYLWGFLASFCWSPLMGFDLASILSPWAERIGFFGPTQKGTNGRHR